MKAPHRLIPLLLLMILVLTVNPPASAQRGGGGAGPTPLGREGAVWQQDQALALEKIKDFERGLAELGDDEWREEAVAWLRLDVAPEDGSAWRFKILEKEKIAAIDAGKKADVETAPNGWLPWTVTGKKRLPRSLDVTLTDVDATEVSCLLRGEAPEGSARLGIFLLEGQLLCAYRSIGEGS